MATFQENVKNPKFFRYLKKDLQIEMPVYRQGDKGDYFLPFLDKPGVKIWYFIRA